MESTRHELCEELQRHSFAIIELSHEEEDLVRRAHGIARDWFFDGVSEVEKGKTRKLFCELGSAKGLVGYNRPTVAKEVYRMRKGRGQPWPSCDAFRCCNHQRGDNKQVKQADAELREDLGSRGSCRSKGFRETMEQTLELLEDILATCLRIVALDIGLEEDALVRMCEHPMERIKHRQDEEPEAVEWFSNSPFDLFHYFNSPEAGQTMNCNVHVDPGLITVVPCSPVPGLCICDNYNNKGNSSTVAGDVATSGSPTAQPADDNWVAAEAEVMTRPFGEVIVFCGDMLKQISSGRYRGALHCVDKDDDHRPRTSLVYELRPYVNAKESSIKMAAANLGEIDNRL